MSASKRARKRNRQRVRAKRLRKIYPRILRLDRMMSRVLSLAIDNRFTREILG